MVYFNSTTPDTGGGDLDESNNNLIVENITSEVIVSDIVDQTNVYFYRISNLVVIVGRLYVTLAMEESKVFILPVQPFNPIYFNMNHIYGNYTATGNITEKGNIYMRYRNNASDLNQWFYISLAFKVKQ